MSLFEDHLKAIFTTSLGVFIFILFWVFVWLFVCGITGKFQFWKLGQIPIPAKPRNKRRNFQIVGFFGAIACLGFLVCLSSIKPDDTKNETDFWLGSWKISPSEIINHQDNCGVVFEKSEKSIRGTIYNSKDKELGYFAKIQYSKLEKGKITGTISLLNGNRYDFETTPSGPKNWKCIYHPKGQEDQIKSFTGWKE